jgi:mono/diheme cytochrome c family protein
VVKLLLIAPLLLIGLFNLVVSGPRLGRAARQALHLEQTQSAGGRYARVFRLAVRGEVLLAFGVLAAAGVMTSSQPAKDAWADLTRGVTLEKKAENLDLRLRVDPGEPGFNDFTLTVRDARSGKPVTDAEKVALIVSMVEHDMGENELVLDNQGNGTYEAQSGLTAMVGTWNAEALVRRQGRDDVRAPFTFSLGTQPAANPQASGNPGAAGAVGAPGTPVAPADARFLKNPIAPTDDSLARGQQLYQQNCMVCHGVQGRGDGPAARAMRPPPADLTQHVTAHTEGELWWWITNGVAGTQMPAWKNSLSDNERWDVLNYIVKAFAPGASNR